MWDLSSCMQSKLSPKAEVLKHQTPFLVYRQDCCDAAPGPSINTAGQPGSPRG